MRRRTNTAARILLRALSRCREILSLLRITIARDSSLPELGLRHVGRNKITRLVGSGRGLTKEPVRRRSPTRFQSIARQVPRVPRARRSCRKNETGACCPSGFATRREKPMPRIKHIALTTKDPGKTAAFYKEAFGMQEIRRAPNGAVFLTDGYIN